MDEILLILLAIAWALGTPILAIMALVRTSGLREQNAKLGSEIAQLRQQIGSGTVVVAAAPEPALPPPFVAEPEFVRVAPPVVETVSVPLPLETLPPEFLNEPNPAPVAASFQVEPPKAGWEQRLGAKAFIWIGAITLALSALFLVRYSIEEGYLSPEVRVILAALFGAGLIAGAEWMRTRDDRISQGLAAAGVAALYGSLFAAVSLYGMVSRPMVAPRPPRSLLSPSPSHCVTASLSPHSPSSVALPVRR